MIKKLGCLLTALLLAWSVTACAVPAAAEEEEDPEEEELAAEEEETREIAAADIALDQEVMVQVDAGEARYFRFVPRARDGYCFRSLSDNEEYDPAGYLYDANLQLIAAGDDDAGGINFKISAMLEKGKTYYLGCEIVGDIEGSYPLRLEKASGLMAAEAEKVPETVRKNMKLSVRATATAKTKLTYQWYIGEGDIGEDDGIDELDWRPMERQNRAAVTIASPAAKTGYCCLVSDNYGNEKAVYFFLDGETVLVYNNAAFSSGEEEDPEEETDAGEDEEEEEAAEEEEDEE